jgi:hypothetical protein
MEIYFSDVFRVAPRDLDKYGAFNISLVADLPLFVDPFLVFNSRKPHYKKLHRGIVRYLQFLFKKSRTQSLSPALLGSWYRFPEITENWLGFSETGNQGRGLGAKFANALHGNFGLLFYRPKGKHITKGVHLEKLCLIDEGVGKDNISDFTTNLIHGYLLDYTSNFARKHIDKALRRIINVRKARFNYQTETWESRTYDLPMFQNHHVLLTPKELLTRDDTWINRNDLFEDFDRLPEAIPNDHLREQISNYFLSFLPKASRKRNRKKLTKAEHSHAVAETLKKFPELMDYYIRDRESRGSEARIRSRTKVAASKQLFVEQIKALRRLLETTTDFYKAEASSYKAAHDRALYLKDVIENKGGHKLFYSKGKPVEREADLQVIYRFTWFKTSFDVSREANDGRGPADYKITKGAMDKSLVEMKLASNSSLERNLKNQAAVYEKASDAKRSIKMIICFTKSEQARVNTVLKRLKLVGDESVVVIDARSDNKPSGSKA